MFNQKQLEVMGFEFQVHEVDGAQTFSWLFSVGELKSSTQINKDQLVVRQSTSQFSSMKNAVIDAIMTGNQFNLAQCDNCSHVCEFTDLGEITDYHERVGADGETPCGECPKCGALSYSLKMLPDFNLVMEYLGLDTSFQYDSEQIIKYSEEYVEAAKKAKFVELANLDHREMVGYERAINDVIDRMALLIARAEESSLNASKALGTMAQVGANASLTNFKTAFLVAIGQGKSPAGELMLIQALEKARNQINPPKPTQVLPSE